MVVFLEALRCIAAPITDTNVSYLPQGMLAPDCLKRGYFCQTVRKKNGHDDGLIWPPASVVHGNEAKADPFVAGGDRRLQDRMFRSSILATYTHVLLRSAAKRFPRFCSEVVEQPDHRVRYETFRQALATEENASWRPVVDAAAAFIRHAAFHRLYLEDHFGDSLRGLEKDTRLSGRRAVMEPVTLTVATTEQHDICLSMQLPPILAALLHVCVSGTGVSGSLFPETHKRLAPLLYDEHRAGRLAHMLKRTSEPGGLHNLGDSADGSCWVMLDVPHDTGKTPVPSAALVEWASFCLVIEAILAQELVLPTSLAASSREPGKPPRIHMQKDSKTAQDHPAEEHQAGGVNDPSQQFRDALQRQQSALEKIISQWVSGRDARMPAPRDQRFALTEVHPSTDTLVFMPSGLADLAAGPRAIDCRVEHEDDAAIPSGAIWLPMPQHLVGTKLDLDAVVFRYEPSSKGTDAHLDPLDFVFAEYFAHDEGVLYSLEPADWDNPAWPEGWGKGNYRVFANLGLVGTRRDPKHLLCVIVCVDEGSVFSGSRS